MKLLVVGKVVTDQVKRLDEEARKLGHKTDNCSSYDLIIKTEKGIFLPQVKDLKLEEYDLIYLLTVGKRKWEWYVACDFLKRNYGVEIVEAKFVGDNSSIYHTSTAELPKQVELGINFPKTTVIVSPKNLEKVLKDFEYPVIIKNNYQQRGLGVYKAGLFEEAKEIVAEDKESNSFMIREFIPNEGDIRIFVVGFKAIAAMRRIPPEDDFRSNISRGAKAEPYELNENPEIKTIAERVAKMNSTQIAGVDVMLHKETKVPYILEINRSPQFRGLEKYTDKNIAREIIKYFESLV